MILDAEGAARRAAPSVSDGRSRVPSGGPWSFWVEESLGGGPEDPDDRPVRTPSRPEPGFARREANLGRTVPDPEKGGSWGKHGFPHGSYSELR